MRVRLRNGYTQANAQIMQHTHMPKAVTGHVEAKKLLSRRRQLNYSSRCGGYNLTRFDSPEPGLPQRVIDTILLFLRAVSKGWCEMTKLYPTL